MLSSQSMEDRSRNAREFGLESVLAAVPGAAVLVLDLDAGVQFAEGATSSCWGVDSAFLSGRRLSDVLADDGWAALTGPYDAAIAGQSSTFDFSAQENVYSIRVSPRLSGGEVVGAIAVARDVTDHRRLESLVSTHEVVVRDADRWFEMSNDMLATASLDGYFTRLNPSWERCLGYTEQELMSEPYIKRIHPDDLQSTLDVAGSLADGPSEIVNFENRYQTKNGGWRWLLWSSRSDAVRVYAVAKDITERKEAELALRASSQRLQAIVDNTPGALSVKRRDYRYQLVNREFERTFGLEPDWILGRRYEEILPRPPSRVLAIDRESDELVFMNGEVIEQEEVVREDESERVHLTIKFPLREVDGEIYAVCAIVTDVTDRKRREHESQDRLEWTARIADAMARDLLVLHAQPIVNLATGEVEQSELLLRMRDRHDASILLMPDEFLPAAERFDLIGAIDLWVVTEALDLANQGHHVEINLSGKTISNPEQVAEIERLVVVSGAAPQSITFEITETAAAEDLVAARHFAQRLRGLGCSFALDDFGVGFGAFTYLKHLRVDFLKIDVEFVRDLVSNEADRQVVRTIAGVAHDFGMKTIAEGVEDQATFDLLRRMGVDYAQGYWIGRPKAIEEPWPSGHTAAESDSPPRLPSRRPDDAEVIGTPRPPSVHLVQQVRIAPGLRSADGADRELALRLQDALRHGDGKAAEAVADEALRSGLDVPAIHARLIAPAMDGIGALWAKNLITVGEEHLATAISHGVAARIFPRALQAAPRSREQVMLAAVQGEHHTLGLRLAADVLEGAGYGVLFLGADVPLSALLEACRIHEPAVLGLSVSMWLNVPTLIWELEALAELPDPPAIMIGGRAVSPTLEKGLRAPVIIDSEQVLDIVAGLIASPRSRDLVDPGLASRIPSRASAEAVPTEAKETIQAGFSATSLAAADAVRESALHAFGLEQLAYRDGLTGLYNRRAFDDRFLEMSAETPDESVMLMIDVDKFKSINDESGHEAGDGVLVDVARTILQTIRPGDFAARFGGDEFVALLTDMSAAEGAAIAERIRIAVAGPSSSRPRVTLSIGVAAFSASNRLTSQSADRALYRAKESGRNRVSVSEGLD